MKFAGFIGPSYTLESVNADCQRALNLFPQVNEIGSGPDGDVASFVSTPGLRLLCTLPTSPVRGVYADSNGDLFAVGGNKFYTIDSDFVATQVGTLSTDTGPVSMSDNGRQVVIVDGDYGYVWTISSEDPDFTDPFFAQITDVNFPGADMVTFQDGYFIFNKTNTQQFFISAINDVVFDALDFASSEASPDNLIGLVSDLKNLYLFGTRSTEIYYNSGNADFPFERMQGAVIEVGCAAPFSIVKLQSAVYWIGQDETGRGTVYRASGLQPQRISTHAIEKVILGLGDVSEARAWVYQQGGHSFYCLNLPNATTTWVFDTTTSLWHERSYLNSGEIERHRADCHAFAYSENVVGDYGNGKIYALDRSYWSDDGDEILRERTAPHFTREGRRVIHSKFQLFMETGVGLDGVGQGTDPQVILQWSNDGGHTWSNENLRPIGAIGERGTRVIWRRLGSARDRVYRVRITDPVPVTILAADLGVEEGVA